MKISKVKHIRVGVKLANNGSGMLYRNTEENAVEKHIETHIKNSVLNAAKLYNILTQKPDYKLSDKLLDKYNLKNSKDFNSKEIKKNKERVANILSGRFNKLFNKCIKNQSTYIAINNLKNYKEIKPLAEFGEYLELIEEIIEFLTNFRIKKSMARVAKPENKPEVDIAKVINTMLIACVNDKEYKKFTERLDETKFKNEIETFIEYANEDCSKKKLSEKIQKSIENQNVRIQVDNNKLVPASCFTESKSFVFNWIKEYACSDIDKKKAMIKAFRDLAIEFCYGEKKAVALKKYKEIVKEENIEIENEFRFENNENDYLTFLKDDFKYVKEIEDIKDKLEKKKLNNIINEKVSITLIERYRKIKARLEQESNNLEYDLCWLGYIQNAVEKELLGDKRKKKNKNNKRKKGAFYSKNLCQLVMNEWRSYIATKYVDLGKGVFHFIAKDKLENDTNGKVCDFSKISDRYKNGICSFDYEMIKAEESINRDIAVQIVFATNCFNNAAFSDEKRKLYKKENKDSNTEDCLLYDKNAIDAIKRDDAKLKIFQFFGGNSKWPESINKEWDNSEKDNITAIKNAIYNVRNTSFHYTGNINKKNKVYVVNNSFIKSIFSEEYKNLNNLFRKKWYSNSTLSFYLQEDINGLINILYHEESNRPAQIPAFNRVLKKTEIIETIVNKKCYEKIKKAGVKKSNFEKTDKQENLVVKLEGALYFMLKEIYYNKFIQEPKCKEWVIETVQKEYDDLEHQLNELKNEYENKDIKKRKKEINKAKEPKSSFIDRINEFPSYSFSEICQLIMTDYNMQNTNKEKKASDSKEKESYIHFPLILKSAIKKAFIKYIKNNYEFIKTPKYPLPNISEEEFCNQQQSVDKSTIGIFKSIENEFDINNNYYITDWYVTAHFINPRALNHLIGSMKNYVNFIGDINKRAKSTGHKEYEIADSIEKYNKIIKVLEFVLLYCGNISSEFSDYYSSEVEYDKFIEKFVDFKNKSLYDFSREKCPNSLSGDIGLFYDGERPILNKNIVYADMYGTIPLLEKCVDKITKENIFKYYKEKNSLQGIFNKPKCENEDEQEKVKNFQSIKNRVEFVDLLKYTEIINDLYSQLISWAYLRERDLMYFQLGVQYIRLFHSDDIIGECSLRKIVSQNCKIQEGALLYQIIALYTNNLNFFKNDGKIAGGSTGSRFKIFQNYCNKSKQANYMDCLEFFEDTNEHSNIIDTRNYIDHYKVFADSNHRSFISLYSEVFDRFFVHDIKLQKSVTFIFKNILMRYFIKATTELGKTKYIDENDIERDGFLIRLVPDVKHYNKPNAFVKKGLTSGKLTYKFDNKICKIDAVSDVFLRQLRRIIED